MKWKRLLLRKRPSTCVIFIYMFSLSSLKWVIEQRNENKNNNKVTSTLPVTVLNRIMVPFDNGTQNSTATSTENAHIIDDFFVCLIRFGKKRWAAGAWELWILFFCRIQWLKNLAFIHLDDLPTKQSPDFGENGISGKKDGDNANRRWPANSHFCVFSMYAIAAIPLSFLRRSDASIRFHIDIFPLTLLPCAKDIVHSHCRRVMVAPSVDIFAFFSVLWFSSLKCFAPNNKLCM